jgi:hypothetical protein
MTPHDLQFTDSRQRSRWSILRKRLSQILLWLSAVVMVGVGCAIVSSAKFFLTSGWDRRIFDIWGISIVGALIGAAFGFILCYLTMGFGDMILWLFGEGPPEAYWAAWSVGLPASAFTGGLFVQEIVSPPGITVDWVTWLAGIIGGFAGMAGWSLISSRFD